MLNFTILRTLRNIRKCHGDLPMKCATHWPAHGYFKVDLEIVWTTIHRDLAELARQVESLRQQNDQP